MLAGMAGEHDEKRSIGRIADQRLAAADPEPAVDGRRLGFHVIERRTAGGFGNGKGADD